MQVCAEDTEGSEGLTQPPPCWGQRDTRGWSLGRGPGKACAHLAVLDLGSGCQSGHGTLRRMAWFPSVGWVIEKGPQNRALELERSEFNRIKWTLKEGSYELHLASLIIKITS